MSRPRQLAAAAVETGSSGLLSCSLTPLPALSPVFSFKGALMQTSFAVLASGFVLVAGRGLHAERTGSPVATAALPDVPVTRHINSALNAQYHTFPLNPLF